MNAQNNSFSFFKRLEKNETFIYYYITTFYSSKNKNTKVLREKLRRPSHEKKLL